MKFIFLFMMLVIAACGKDGAQGPQGSIGPSGTSCSIVDNTVSCPDGSSTTFDYVVQLCPGKSHYPDTFVEYAICIQGNLYGVYSANDGFLAYLPPGNYTSNAIGSACDLTIEPNCKVTN